MAYSINPNLVNARKEVLLAVIADGMPVCTAARRFGIHRSTVWRWVKKWEELNHFTVGGQNYNHPSRHKDFVARNYTWKIATMSSAPKTHPQRIAQWIVQRIVELRKALGRCAVIIHNQLLKEGIRICVSTVERVIAKFCVLKTKRRHIRRTLPRPDVQSPGDLVEMDTVHYVDKLTGDRLYIFTVVDIYSRMAYARPQKELRPGRAYQTLLEAEEYFGFRASVVQTDNGPEFGGWFTSRAEAELVDGAKRVHRHTRIHRPNDNAHVERFNRTLREECIGNHMSCHDTPEDVWWKLGCYIDYYNEERLHLGIQCRTPRQQQKTYCLEQARSDKQNRAQNP